MVSPYIKNTFENLTINDSTLDKYAAGYMWGNLGVVYNPEVVSEEEANTWNILLNKNYYKSVTIKDSVRDAYFGAMGIYNKDILESEDFRGDSDYHDKLAAVMNDTGSEAVGAVQHILDQIKDNVYSFETDSGKADMVTGKVVANMQWSGDGVYTLDQAEEDGIYLNYAVPDEVSNLWFDGWCMLKKGLAEDEKKQHAAEAFVNFISRPDNAIRNMYYIGYTSVIAGGDSDMMFEYADWCYGAEEDAEDVVEYPLGYFFSGDAEDEDYVITAEQEQTKRQLFAQYPPEDVLDRCAVMGFFDAEENERVNRMWTNIRCFDIGSLF